jgi:hypothetical protein
VGRVDDHAAAPRALDDPEPYLLEHSGLPGPRGNIELGRAAAATRSPQELRRNLRWVARENLRKRRLTRLDADWVAALAARPC